MGDSLEPSGVEEEIVLWNTVRNRLEREIPLPLESTGAVGFAPDGSLGITCAPSKPGSRANGEQTLLIWDIAQNREIKRISAVPNATTGISFSPDGTHVALGSGSAGSILAFDLTGANAAISLDPRALGREGAKVSRFSDFSSKPRC